MVRSLDRPFDPGSKVERGDADSLSGARKAAVLLLALDDDVASDLLGRLSDAELEALSEEISRLRVVGSETLQIVLESFCDLAGARASGGESRTASRIALEPPSGVASREGDETIDQDGEPFAFLRGLSAEEIEEALAGEPPQALAVALSHVPAARAAEVLERMDAELGRDVLRRIASLEAIDDEAMRQLESGLRRHVSGRRELGPSSARGGIDAAVDILRAAGTRGRTFLDELSGEEPDLAGQIRRELFAFEDIENFGDAKLRALAAAVDHRVAALAIRGAPRRLEERWLAAFSDSRRALVRSLLDESVAVRLADIARAREEIAAIALDLGDVEIEEKPARRRRKPRRRR